MRTEELVQITPPATRQQHLARLAAMVAAAALFLRQVAPRNMVDIDLYHQMALFRAALTRGWIPFEDVFAFTPTAYPSVHYEWGHGAICYAILGAVGVGGLLALKFFLAGASGVLAVSTARQRGADWRVLSVLAPVSIFLASGAFSTVRAGMFTMAFTALLLLLLECDRRGNRAWVLAWLPIHLVWVNIHPGFVVGMGVLAAHWFERLIRHKQLQWHLVLTGIATVVLVFVNPYGVRYPQAVLHAVAFMKLPAIPEWLPMWRYPETSMKAVYAVSVMLIVYALCHRGWRGSEGVLILLVFAVAALYRGRHASLYAVAWFCYVPGWLRATPFGEMLEDGWARHLRKATTACIAVVLACIPAIVAARPFQVKLPTRLDEIDVSGGVFAYPVGAVDYMKGLGLSGNVMTHYNEGAYVMWHLWPAAKVALDSRNDVAYSYELIREIGFMYQAAEGWAQTLGKYDPDVLLVIRTAPLSKVLRGQSAWRLVYQDDAFEVWSRPGLTYPVVDRRGAPIIGSAP